MNKKEVYLYFHDICIPGIKNVESKNKVKDIPLRRVTWINFIDMLQKNGQITEELAFSIEQPNWVKDL